ncbi:MAG: homoserine dehydrogenase [Chloroflexi bacterium]|nr:homoserine dehydrogenase [Chloroflexota bacterium]
MSHYNLAFIGFGNVGQALAQLLHRKQAELESQHNITFTITTIVTGSHGAALNNDGLDMEKALSIAQAGGSLAELSASPAPADTLELIRTCRADVLFENSPVNYQTGQPGLDHLRTALESGMYAITANKGPVVHGFRELTDLAEKNNVRFFFESTVMDGAPIFSLFRETLPSAKLHAFRGVLNSTTNLILSQMEDGASFDEAVSHAQAIGIAETDPSGDVDGWDTAVKLCALVTVLMDFPITTDQVDREGIRGITPQKIAQAKSEGKRWKLVCSAKLDGQSVLARVAPEMVGPDSALFTIDGTTSIVEFETDTLPSLSVIQGNPSPVTTAYGLLADFINAVAE